MNHAHPYQHCAKRDFRELKEGEGGNCAALAYTKKARLERAGVRSTMIACVLRDGQGHAFLLTDAGVLDNRFDRVVRYVDVGCE